MLRGRIIRMGYLRWTHALLDKGSITSRRGFGRIRLTVVAQSFKRAAAPSRDGLRVLRP